MPYGTDQSKWWSTHLFGVCGGQFIVAEESQKAGNLGVFSPWYFEKEFWHKKNANIRP